MTPPTSSMSPGPERSSSGPDSDTSLAEQLAAELADRWQRGEQPRAEELLDRHPDLWARPEVAADIICEEVCARQELGDDRAAAEVLERFPQWRPQLEALLRVWQLFEPDRPDRPPPVAGERVAGFELLAELGRGGRGRVFLASQPCLGGRPVVLKLTPRDGHEHLALARLQHTNIVPLYSAAEDAGQDLRVLCMPYFGGATLARVLEVCRDRPPATRSGQDVLDVVDRETAARPAPPPPPGPARAALGRTSYVRAVCWTGAQLADALQYAHDRELVHLDVKPSNILLASDGQPMLLDFHLARPPVGPADPPPEWLGGTDGYMAPEQEAALAAVRAGRPVPTSIDGRADVYALGLVLYELLGGTCPPPGAAQPRLDRLNPQVSPGLADVLHRCLRPAPGDRYSSAGLLAADLRRHLADEPLRGVPNRSWSERWAKWLRRSPHRLSQVALATAVLLTVVAVVAAAGTYLAEQSAAAHRLLARGVRERETGQAAAALRTLSEARDVARRLPFRTGLTDQIERETTSARDRSARDEQATAWEAEAHELRAFVDRVRFLYGSGDHPPQGIDELRARCEDWWRRGLRLDAAPGAPAGGRERVRHDLLDLAVLWADFRATAGEGEAAAVRILREAADRLGPSPILAHEVRRHTGAGLPTGVEGTEPTPGSYTAWEYYALGRSDLRGGNLTRAVDLLGRAVALEPEGLWPNFYHGVCCFRLGRYEDAVAAFSACVALAPGHAECHYNRGLAFARLKRLDRAIADYTTALRLAPALGIAALNRGVLYFEQGHYAEAGADFEAALRLGADPALARHNLRLVRQAQGRDPANPP